MLLRYLLADIIQPQLIVYLLQEEVAAVVAALFALLYVRLRVIFHDDILVLFFFCVRHFRDSGARPLNGILASQLLAKLLDGPELLDDLRGAPSVIFSERFDCVQVGVTAAFLQLESHICIKIT